MKIICLLSLLAATSFAAESVPKDVSSLLDRNEGCDHWFGEMPDEKTPAMKPRIEVVQRELKKLKCADLDSDFKKLRLKYKSNKAVLEALEHD